VLSVEDFDGSTEFPCETTGSANGVPEPAQARRATDCRNVPPAHLALCRTWARQDAHSRVVEQVSIDGNAHPCRQKSEQHGQRQANK